MGLPRTYKTLEDHTTLGRKKGEHEKDKYFPTLEQYLRRIEKNHIIKVLTKCCWNLSLAADILEISRPTLANKIKLYNLDKPDLKLAKRKMDYLICGKIDNNLDKIEEEEFNNYYKDDKDFKNIYNNAVKIINKLENEDPTALPEEISE